MTDTILYLSILLGPFGIGTLISSFEDNDNNWGDGEIYINYLEFGKSTN